jgi:hypothetical protein
MLGLLRFVTPELKPNIVTVVDCDYKRRIAFCRAGDERKIVVQKLKFIPSSPNIAKPFVACCASLYIKWMLEIL